MYLGSLKCLLAVAICSYSTPNISYSDQLEDLNIAIDYSLFTPIDSQPNTSVSFEINYNYKNINGNNTISDYEENRSYQNDSILTTTGNQENKRGEDLSYFWLRMRNIELYVDASNIEINISNYFVESAFTSNTGEITYWNYSNSLSFFISRNLGNTSTNITIQKYVAKDIEIFLPLEDTIYLGFNEGFREGIINSNAYSIGYTEGLRVGEASGFENGREQGIIEGRDQGFDVGYEQGFTEGEIVGTNKKYSALELVKRAFDIVAIIFKIEILPGIPLAAAFAIPLVLSIVFFVIKIFR